MQAGAVLEYHPAGSWTLHLDFLYVETEIRDLSCILDSVLLSWCHSWLEMAVGDAGQLGASSCPGHSWHPCAKALSDVLNAGSAAENCSFLSVFHLCPKYHGDVDVTGRSRPRVRHT